MLSSQLSFEYPCSTIHMFQLRIPGGQGVGLQGPRGSRGRPTGSKGVKLKVSGIQGVNFNSCDIFDLFFLPLNRFCAPLSLFPAQPPPFVPLWLFCASNKLSPCALQVSCSFENLACDVLSCQVRLKCNLRKSWYHFSTALALKLPLQNE